MNDFIISIHATVEIEINFLKHRELGEKRILDSFYRKKEGREGGKGGRKEIGLLVED